MTRGAIVIERCGMPRSPAASSNCIVAFVDGAFVDPKKLSMLALQPQSFVKFRVTELKP